MSAHASKGIKFVLKTPPLLGHAPGSCEKPSLEGDMRCAKITRERFGCNLNSLQRGLW